MRTIATMLLAVAMLTALTAEARKGKGPAPARERYETAAWSVARPSGDGWLEAPHRPEDVVLVREGAGPDDSWSAQVLVLPPQALKSPQDLAAWLDANYRARLMQGGRFEQRAWTTAPAPERGPACVTHRLSALDREAVLSNGATGALLLDEHGLACDTEAGLILAKVSWRGRGDVAPASLEGLGSEWLAGFAIKKPAR